MRTPARQLIKIVSRTLTRTQSNAGAGLCARHRLDLLGGRRQYGSSPQAGKEGAGVVDDAKKRKRAENLKEMYVRIADVGFFPYPGFF